MSTNDVFGGYAPPPPPPPPPPPAAPTPPAATGPRVLRRVRSGRVAAGVAGGLGEYFGVDPVLFRVLFATSAFFGGAGILAYLLAWAAIPDQGTGNAPIDSWVGALRRRHVPVWLVVIALGVLLWLVAFSWWAPRPFFPVIAAVAVVVVLLARREIRGSAAGEATAPVSLTKADPASATPSWVNDVRAWTAEVRVARRARRRRSLPLRLAMLGALAATLIGLGIADAVHGVELQLYFWATAGIIVVGLIAGAVTRRTPWSAVPLLVVALIGVVALGGSHTSLHDGVGSRQWQPSVAPAAQYRLGVGQGVLDLTSIRPLTGPRTVAVTVGIGQVQVIAPKSLKLTVLANIHIGQLEVDGYPTAGNGFGPGHGHGGFGLSRVVDPPAGATGAPLTVVVHLTDGNITVLHR